MPSSESLNTKASDGTSAPRLLIVEDHGLLAHTLSLALAAEGLRVKVADLASSQGLIAAVEADPPELVLLDLDLGDLGDGADLVAPLTAAGARVLVVTGQRDRARLALCVERGAIGLIDKASPFDELLDAVLATARNVPLLEPQARDDLLRDLRIHRTEERQRLAAFELLTAREREALAALMDGQSVEQMTQAWFVSEATVRSHVRGVLTKLGVTSQLAAVAAAQRAGWSLPTR
jgi:DNA-binding NarL/FixJ family response regulator